MTNPESRSIELEELALSDDADTVDNDDKQITEADVRELSAYGLESNDRTWVGIGTTGSAQSNDVGHFDIEDQTLVGIGSSRSAWTSEIDDFDSESRTLVGMGPVERAERASRARQAQEPPESVRMPQSEPPGPFVAADDELPSAPALPLPMQRSSSWALILPAALVAAAGVVVVRGLMPHPAAPRAHAAAVGVSQGTAHETAVDATAAAETAAPMATSEVATPTRTSEVAAPTGAAESSTASIGAAEATSIASDRMTAVDATAAALAPARASSAKPLSLDVPGAIKRSDRTNPPLGSLDIMSSPAANVVVDGRPLGRAPRVVKIAPGPHTVVFIHPERGRMVLNVNVTAGQTTSAAAEF